jgi:hypothetical protein
MFESWKILCHKGKIPKAKREAYWSNMKTRFKAENIDFSDNDHKIIVYVAYYQFNVRVSFLDNTEYGYGIEFKSETLGYKPHEIKAHERLYHTTTEKIRWKKQGFTLEDNNEIPIPKKDVTNQTPTYFA